ncbi:Uncharacterised protein [Escherichia coli]|uniref:Uncharacterized protein n=1 Tax=Escherichia coli TaxID=562 RepID=A0A376VI20_ECOLX|nr:Uncharacterised protein [Escherichia coli]
MHIADIFAEIRFFCAVSCTLFIVLSSDLLMFPICTVDRQKVAFVNVSITFNNQIILAGLLENTTGMPIPQKRLTKLSN